MSVGGSALDVLRWGLGPSVLGWRTSNRVLLAGWERKAGDEHVKTNVMELSLSTGEHRMLSRFPHEHSDGDDSTIGEVQLATGLVADMEVRSTDTVRTGLWPRWIRVLVTVAVAVPTLLVVGLVALVRWAVRRRLARPGAGGPGAVGSAGR